mmetsp:Transcript_31288/g.28457  ORF Transcript_31288/g.28457 Transcript_31288/m.28457 type:complete len:123 (+) Transcript_31288:1265-1633(+)
MDIGNQMVFSPKEGDQTSKSSRRYSDEFPNREGKAGQYRIYTQQEKEGDENPHKRRTVSADKELVSYSKLRKVGSSKVEIEGSKSDEKVDGQIVSSQEKASEESSSVNSKPGEQGNQGADSS